MVLSGLGSVDTVAQAIQQMEGYYPGSVSYRLNNPGNLIYAGQSGATRDASGFASFGDYQSGYDALIRQINLDASRGLTIQQFMAKYAPASDGNDPVAYANHIASATGLSPSDALSLALADGGADYYGDLEYFGADASGVDPTTIGLALGAAALLFLAVR